MLIGIVQGPDAGTSAQVQHALDFGVGVVWWSQAKLVLQRVKEQVVLQIYNTEQSSPPKVQKRFT